MTSKTYAAWLAFLLLALQWLWHGLLVPPAQFNPWLIALIFSLAMLPSNLLTLLRHKQAAYWGSVAALLYFSHGVMEAWANPDARWLALVQVALSIALVLTASWDGVVARFNKPRA